MQNSCHCSVGSHCLTQPLAVLHSHHSPAVGTNSMKRKVGKALLGSGQGQSPGNQDCVCYLNTETTNGRMGQKPIETQEQSPRAEQSSHFMQLQFMALPHHLVSGAAQEYDFGGEAVAYTHPYTDTHTCSFNSQRDSGL